MVFEFSNHNNIMEKSFKNSYVNENFMFLSNINIQKIWHKVLQLEIQFVQVAYPIIHYSVVYLFIFYT